MIAFGDIEFRDVTYRHRREGADLEDGGGVEALRLRIKEGGFLGVAGRSGAGKTTFADLLVGLYAPQAGEIWVAGRPVWLVGAPDWSKRLAYVAQDSFLSNESLRANLLWGAEKATDAELSDVLELVGAEGLLARLPAGLDTVVGERGGLLSGGERQRFAIARALLRRPSLLILDEATNALDAESERGLLQRLRRVQPALTIVLIAHRAEALRHADRVAMFEAGAVIREGGFADLRDRIADIVAEPATDARLEATSQP